jgi:Chaperone of endosialidase
MFTNYFAKRQTFFLVLPLTLLLSAGAALAQGTAFTFQGKLGDSGSPVNGAFEMQFKLFADATCPPSPAVCTPIGTITLNNPVVQVTNGVFTVQLDFGAAALPGAERFLEIGIRRNSTDPYTLLSPRSKITSSPYAIRSLNATRAEGLSSTCVGCIQNSQINTLDASKLTGTIPASSLSASSLPAGSGSYIQNQTLNPQSAGFNIGGNGLISGNVGIGYFAGSTPQARLHVSVASGTVRARIDSPTDAGLTLALSNLPGWSVAATSGGWFQIINNSTSGNAKNAFWIDSSNNVGIGTTPSDRLHVAGIVRVNVFGLSGQLPLCRNASGQISFCSSSLRYKANIAPFSTGLALIKRLRPITFDWKQGGEHDVGLGAEEVAKIDPLFVTYNSKGEVEGVKYDRLSAAFVNAFKEQQAQIEQQQREIEALKELVCATNTTAEICKRKNK